ncbi:MAG: hypothetical protein EOM66_10740 [Clostridia bacterium]|nr:hypothetical protein [Candidatus Pelethousia sp.]NCB31868.1 hypothetical protein [Clostridia bacterium]
MDHNTKLLQSIYENATMGKISLGRLIKRCEDANFRQVMADQFAEYHEIQDEVEKLFKSTYLEPKQPILTPLKKHICLNLAIDRSSTHMAEMLMHGSLLGIVDIARERRECNAASEESRELATRLLITEENNLRRLQKFL